MRVLFVLALATALFLPLAVAQKPPAPTPTPPPPPSSSPGNTTAPAPLSSDPSQTSEDRVMYLQGRVATSDGTALPNDVKVERVCNNQLRQQVYASFHGDFTMQLGSQADSYMDASGDPSSRSLSPGKDSLLGIPRRQLANCELRASAAGFRSAVINLINLDAFLRNIDVGEIVIQRTTKIAGTTLSAMPYKAPPNARKAYEKGVEALRKANLANAQSDFEQAVKLYPKYAIAWFQLGSVLEKENRKDAARAAFTQATTIDAKFLPPYLSLAAMAYEEGNWPVVLTLTDHILAHDPLNKVDVRDYIVDLDPFNCAEAYFYNAVANYMLNKFEAAEKSGLKAEHVDLLTRFPELHLLLGEIFARKNDYPNAISEFQNYLELAPHAKKAASARERLAELKTLSGSASTTEKPDRM
jgi:tetratricopeptide (TPR) repeat protein